MDKKKIKKRFGGVTMPYKVITYNLDCSIRKEYYFTSEVNCKIFLNGWKRLGYGKADSWLYDDVLGDYEKLDY